MTQKFWDQIAKGIYNDKTQEQEFNPTARQYKPSYAKTPDPTVPGAYVYTPPAPGNAGVNKTFSQRWVDAGGNKVSKDDPRYYTDFDQYGNLFPGKAPTTSNTSGLEGPTEKTTSDDSGLVAPNPEPNPQTFQDSGRGMHYGGDETPWEGFVTRPGFAEMAFGADQDRILELQRDAVRALFGWDPTSKEMFTVQMGLANLTREQQQQMYQWMLDNARNPYERQSVMRAIANTYGDPFGFEKGDQGYSWDSIYDSGGDKAFYDTSLGSWKSDYPGQFYDYDKQTMPALSTILNNPSMWQLATGKSPAAMGPDMALTATYYGLNFPGKTQDEVAKMMQEDPQGYLNLFPQAMDANYLAVQANPEYQDQGYYGWQKGYDEYSLANDRMGYGEPQLFDAERYGFGPYSFSQQGMVNAVLAGNPSVSTDTSQQSVAQSAAAASTASQWRGIVKGYLQSYPEANDGDITNYLLGKGLTDYGIIPGIIASVRQEIEG